MFPIINKRNSFWPQFLENPAGISRSRLVLPGSVVLVFVFLYYLGDGLFTSELGEISFLRGHAYHEILLLFFSGTIIITSAFWRIRWGLVFTAIGFLLLLPHTFIIPAYPDPLYRVLSWLAINVLLAIVVGGALNNRVQQLSYLREIINAQEKERHRLSRELHDDTAQGLIDMAHAIDELVETAPLLPSKAIDELKNMRDEVDNILEMTRRAIQGLQPSLIDEVGVKPALLWLCDEFAEDTGIEIMPEIDISDDVLSDEAKIAIYRISQEALANIKKHAEASRVDMTLAPDGDKIRLSIKDNGKGFTFSSWGSLRTSGKAGLFGIQQRTAVVRGTLQIISGPGKGTALIVKIPLAS